jgi:dTDP-4-dehydrorhamnose 3,5-epimerase
MQDVVHARPSLGAAVLEDVEGFTSASPRQSLTTGAGALRIAPIDGVRYRLARPVSHHHGHLTEVFRADWGLTDAPVVQVNATTTVPGRIRAWGIHRLTVDRLFAATGSLCVVCYDGRRGSPTFGCVNEFMLGERNQGLIVIPPGYITGGRMSGRTRRRSSACRANFTTTTAPIAGSCRGTQKTPEKSSRTDGHSSRLKTEQRAWRIGRSSASFCAYDAAPFAPPRCPGARSERA